MRNLQALRENFITEADREIRMTSCKAYQSWKESQIKTLEDLRNKQFFMLFSGGKDSSLALDFMLKASKELRFELEVHAGIFPVHRYPDEEMEKIGSYWERRGVTVNWHKLADTDSKIENTDTPCIVCQELRKEVLNIVLSKLVKDWKDLIIVTSYSLWDIVSYSLEEILSEKLGSSPKGHSGSDRFLTTAQRFYPLLEMKEGFKIYRPLIRYNSNNILEVLKSLKIPFITRECKFETSRPKRILEKYYQNMGMVFDYERVFRFARECLDLPGTESYDNFDREKYLLKVF